MAHGPRLVARVAWHSGALDSAVVRATAYGGALILRWRANCNTINLW